MTSSFDDVLTGVEVPPATVHEVIVGNKKVALPKMRSDVKLSSMKPVIGQVIDAALSIFKTDKDDFELSEEFINTDPVVGGNADALALLVQKAYRGPRIKPDESKINEDDEDAEDQKDKKQKGVDKIKETLAKADEILYSIDYKGILSAASINIFQDGDVLIREVKDREFQFLPRRIVTAVPEKYLVKVDDGKGGKALRTKTFMFNQADKKKDTTSTLKTGLLGEEIIMDIDYYVLNEGTTWEEVIPKEQMIHIKYNPHGRMVHDQLGRPCFNVWSVAPMRRLKKTMLWKANAMVNDILWRGAMPPREHHKLDLAMFSPDNYDGDTPEERVAAAKAAAKGVIREYINWISSKEVDTGYVTDLTTEIGVIEARSQSYADPNELLRQLDESVHATSGIPRGAMYGEGSKAFASELLVSNYAGLRAEFIGDRISRPFEDWLKAYMKKNYPKNYPAKYVDKLRLKFRLILPRDVREIAQGVNLLMDSMIVDVAQILETVGLDTMTEEQMKEHLRVVGEMSEAKQTMTFGQVDTKGFDQGSKAESRKNEPDTTKANKELTPDKLGK